MVKKLNNRKLRDNEKLTATCLPPDTAKFRKLEEKYLERKKRMEEFFQSKRLKGLSLKDYRK